MNLILLSSLVLIVVVCYSNGAPVGNAQREKRSHDASKKHKKGAEKKKHKVEPASMDSHVTETKAHSASSKKCICPSKGKKHTVEVKSKKAKNEKCVKRDTCFNCCCHPPPTQHQHEDCDHDGENPHGEPDHQPPDIHGPTGEHRFHAAGENGCGYCHCRPLGPSGHGAHAGCYDTCCKNHQNAGSHAHTDSGGHNTEQDALPSMKCVHVGGNICLGLPHPCLQLCGEQPVEHRTPPSTQVVCVNGNIAMGIPHPEYQVDCNQTIGNLLTDACMHADDCCHSSESLCGSSCGCGGGGGGGGCGGCGDCGHGDCGHGDCGHGDCGHGDCGHGGHSCGYDSYPGDHMGESFHTDRGVPSYHNNDGHAGEHVDHNHAMWPGGHNNHGGHCCYHGGDHGGDCGGGGGCGGCGGCHHGCDHGGHHCENEHHERGNCRDNCHDDDDDDDGKDNHPVNDDFLSSELKHHMMIKPGGMFKCH